MNIQEEIEKTQQMLKEVNCKIDLINEFFRLYTNFILTPAEKTEVQ